MWAQGGRRFISRVFQLAKFRSRVSASRRRHCEKCSNCWAIEDRDLDSLRFCCFQWPDKVSHVTKTQMRLHCDVSPTFYDFGQTHCFPCFVKMNECPECQIFGTTLQMNLCTFAQVEPRAIHSAWPRTCIGSYLAVVACLADIAKLFLSDGVTLENSIVEFLQYKFYFIHAEYSLKIHWWFHQCFQRIMAISLDVTEARATTVGLR